MCLCAFLAFLHALQASRQHQQQVLAGDTPAWTPERSWHGVLTESAESSAVDVGVPVQQQQLAASSTKHAGSKAAVAAAAAAGRRGESVQRSGAGNKQQQKQQKVADAGQAAGSRHAQVQQQQQDRSPLTAGQAATQQLAKAAVTIQQQKLQQAQDQQVQRLQQVYAVRGQQFGAVKPAAVPREEVAVQDKACAAPQPSEAEAALRVRSSVVGAGGETY
jgi:hypothetical protein